MFPHPRIPRAALLAAGLALATLPARAANPPPFKADLDRLHSADVRTYRAVKPTKKELQWSRIPWLTDLNAALKLAKKEKRPLFLWVSGDDPLERC
jgi:hypothetical protein